MTPSRRHLLLAAAGLPLLTACGQREGADTAGFQGVDITGATYARELSLPDVDGKPRTLAEWKGKVVVLFFGYAQCPDVCPATMAEIAEVKRALGEQGDKLQGVFVTLDPERDTPELLKAYVANFDPAFVALRGTPEQTQAAAKEFKVFYAKVPGKAEGSYTLDHTAGAFVFDPQGRIRLFTRYGAGAPALAADVKRLLASA
ncbi:SCO family protein [Aquabacterium sp. J223]|uniref:SCO family protein n=1 Tax=Aquabacterium sp. J223 TaxID=2898431 RepID=UPI0021AE0866|nr:SCO family protein [Aquabacterium sp. J223]UUX95674.1 SCO family protein [Aquabacterium sp. J223]